MKKGSYIAFIFIAIFVIIYIGIASIFKHYDRQYEKVELLKNEEIDHYKRRLATKHKLDIKQLELISYTQKHKEKQGTGVWFDTKEVAVPDFLKFKYNDKIITVYNDHDDFLYDDFVKALNKYYSDRLGIEKLIVETDSISDYAGYFIENYIYKIDDSVIEKFIDENYITIYAEINNSDKENTIKQVIDKMNNLKKEVRIQVMNDISMIKVYREQPNYIYFDYYYVKNIDYKYRYATIWRERQYCDLEKSVYYNNYCYSKNNN